MCGIAGVLDAVGPPGRRATCCSGWATSIAHRGPGRRGAVRRRAASASGNRRLAIIDPTPAGRAADGDRATAASCITYNGEVYNFRELRAELEAGRAPLPLAHRHRGRAQRLRRSGAPRRVERFNGMFAFAIWDRAARRAVPRPRPLRRQAALLRGPPRRRSCSARRSSRCSSTTAFGARLEPAAPARVLHVPEHLHRRHAVRRRPAAAARATTLTRRAPTAARRGRSSYWDFDFREPDDGAARRTRSTTRSSTASSARPSTASSSATCRSAPT